MKVNGAPTIGHGGCSGASAMEFIEDIPGDVRAKVACALIKNHTPPNRQAREGHEW
jgi:hypothetical protein